MPIEEGGADERLHDVVRERHAVIFWTWDLFEVNRGFLVDHLLGFLRKRCFRWSDAFCVDTFCFNRSLRRILVFRLISPYFPNRPPIELPFIIDNKARLKSQHHLQNKGPKICDYDYISSKKSL